MDAYHGAPPQVEDILGPQAARPQLLTTFNGAESMDIDHQPDYGPSSQQPSGGQDHDRNGRVDQAADAQPSQTTSKSPEPALHPQQAAGASRSYAPAIQKPEAWLRDGSSGSSAAASGRATSSGLSAPLGPTETPSLASMPAANLEVFESDLPQPSTSADLPQGVRPEPAAPGCPADAEPAGVFPAGLDERSNGRAAAGPLQAVGDLCPAPFLTSSEGEAAAQDLRLVAYAAEGGEESGNEDGEQDMEDALAQMDAEDVDAGGAGRTGGAATVGAWLDRGEGHRPDGDDEAAPAEPPYEYGIQEPGVASVRPSVPAMSASLQPEGLARAGTSSALPAGLGGSGASAVTAAIAATSHAAAAAEAPGLGDGDMADEAAVGSGGGGGAAYWYDSDDVYDEPDHPYGALYDVSDEDVDDVADVAAASDRGAPGRAYQYGHPHAHHQQHPHQHYGPHDRSGKGKEPAGGPLAYHQGRSAQPHGPYQPHNHYQHSRQQQHQQQHQQQEWPRPVDSYQSWASQSRSGGPGGAGGPSTSGAGGAGPSTSGAGAGGSRAGVAGCSGAGPSTSCGYGLGQGLGSSCPGPELVAADPWSEDEEEDADTTAEQFYSAAHPKDIQGIPWERLQFNRSTYRETRLRQYRNYTNLLPDDDGGAYRAELAPLCAAPRRCGTAGAGGGAGASASRGPPFFSFVRNSRAVQSNIVHFQLRNLVWATSPNDVFVVHDNCINHWNPAARRVTEVLNLTGGVGGGAGGGGGGGGGAGGVSRGSGAASSSVRVTGLGRVQVSTLCVVGDLVAAGGFMGELVVRRLSGGPHWPGAQVAAGGSPYPLHHHHLSHPAAAVAAAAARERPSAREAVAAAAAAAAAAAGGAGAAGGQAGLGGAVRGGGAVKAAGGGAQGPLLFCGRITSSENGITNGLEIYPDRVHGTVIMSANNDAQLRLFAAAAGEGSLRPLTRWPFDWAVNYATVRPDSHLAAVVGDAAATLLTDVHNGTTVARLEGHRDFSFAAAWHPGGVLLATGNQDTTTLLWDVRRTDEPLTRLAGRMGAIRSLRFTPDGRFLAMSEPADFVHVYDVASGFQDCQEHDFFGEIAGIAFTPDSGSLFVGVSDLTYASLMHLERQRCEWRGSGRRSLQGGSV